MAEQRNDNEGAPPSQPNGDSSEEVDLEFGLPGAKVKTRLKLPRWAVLALQALGVVIAGAGVAIWFTGNPHSQQTQIDIHGVDPIEHAKVWQRKFSPSANSTNFATNTQD